MTAITTPTTPSVTPRRNSPHLLILNACVALCLLAALPVIYKGQQGFAPYATLDKQYVDSTISSGEIEFIHKALKTTEIARALAYESHVHTMGLMQLGVLALAVLFALNSFLLYRHLRAPSRT